MKISSSWFLATRSDSSEIQSEDAVGKRCQREKHFSSTHCFLKSVSIKLVSLPYINFYWLCAVATSVRNPWTCNLTTTITGHSLLFPISHFLLFPWHCLLPRYHGSHPQIISPPNSPCHPPSASAHSLLNCPRDGNFKEQFNNRFPLKASSSSGFLSCTLFYPKQKDTFVLQERCALLQFHPQLSDGLFLPKTAQNLHNFTYKTSSSQPKPAWGWTNFAMRFRRWKFPVPRPQEKQPLAAQLPRATSKGSNCRLTALPGWNPTSAASPTKHGSFTEQAQEARHQAPMLSGAPKTDPAPPSPPQHLHSPSPWWDAVGSALVAPRDAAWGASVSQEHGEPGHQDVSPRSLNPGGGGLASRGCWLSLRAFLKAPKGEKNRLFPPSVLKVIGSLNNSLVICVFSKYFSSSAPKTAEPCSSAT